MQIQGYACDDNWQKEGHRPLGILKHPLPITSLTKLADEVADTLVNHTSKLKFDTVILVILYL